MSARRVPAESVFPISLADPAWMCQSEWVVGGAPALTWPCDGHYPSRTPSHETPVPSARRARSWASGDPCATRGSKTTGDIKVWLVLQV